MKPYFAAHQFYQSALFSKASVPKVSMIWTCGLIVCGSVDDPEKILYIFNWSMSFGGHGCDTIGDIGVCYLP